MQPIIKRPPIRPINDDNKLKPVLKKNISKNKKKSKLSKFSLFVRDTRLDLPFLFLILTLVVVGLVMLFSASYAFSYYNMKGDSFYFIRSQLIFAVLGVILMLITSRIDYKIFRKLAFPILGISFLLLIIVLFMPRINGVHRWIPLGPLGQFQASEITKFAIVVSFAHLITTNFDKMGTFKHGILPFLMILAPTLVLLVLEPHYSCTIIIILLAAGMLFVGGIKLRWFGMVLGTIFLVLATLFFTGKLGDYAGDRISGWFDPFGPSAMDKTWQTRQSLYAIGSGGLFGAGLGNSRQKYLYIPEPQNDFIFAVVCEELGFIGAVIILLIFAMLIWRGMIISIKARDRFGTLLGIGLTAQVGLQVILNIAVITNTIPNTGITLPFFSHGGTSLLMLLVQMGVILSISRTAKLEAN